MSRANKKKDAIPRKPSGKRSFFPILFLVLLVIVSAVCAAMIVDQNLSLDRIEALSRILEEQEEQVKRENEEAVAEKNRIDTKEFAEEYARDRLGMVKAGETVYQAPDS